MIARPGRLATWQAWRRLWKNVTAGELTDIAADIANYVEWQTEAELTTRQRQAIQEALVSFPWDQQPQA
jgi:hypothetical protein